MKISLNLATRPFADKGPAIRKLRVAMAALVVAGIGLGVALHLVDKQAEEARARDAALQAKIVQVQHERQGYEAMMQQPANAALLSQVQYLNALFDEKAFSWTLAMEDLETVLPGGVQVTQIEPNRQKDGHIVLRLRVQGPRDKTVKLVRNLEHSRHFLEPRIVGESTESSNTPGQATQPVSASIRETFELEAEYNPATAEERTNMKKAATSAGAEERSKESRRTGTVAPASVHHRSPYRRLAPAAGGPR